MCEKHVNILIIYTELTNKEMHVKMGWVNNCIFIWTAAWSGAKSAFSFIWNRLIWFYYLGCVMYHGSLETKCPVSGMDNAQWHMNITINFKPYPKPKR